MYVNVMQFCSGVVDKEECARMLEPPVG